MYYFLYCLKPDLEKILNVHILDFSRVIMRYSTFINPLEMYANSSTIFPKRHKQQVYHAGYKYQEECEL